MIYHRVKKNLDTEYLYGNRLPPYHIIFNELYTARELDKLERKGYRVIDEYFDVENMFLLEHIADGGNK